MRADAKRIVVRAPNWVGDVVMATPTFRALRENYPDSHLALVCKSYVRPILDGSPWFDEIIETEGSGFASFRELTARLRKDRFDLAVLLPNSMRAALEAFCGRARRRIGYNRRGRGVLLTDRIAPPLDERGRFLPTNMVDYYLTLCMHIGCQNLSQREELHVTEACEARADAVLEKYGIDPDIQLIGINPGGAFGSSKLWSANRYAAVADELADRTNCRVMLFGSPSERPILEGVANGMEQDVILLEPGELDLDTLKPLVRRCSLLVTNDTGARHFGVAFDVPVVCIMGSTSSRYTDVNLERQTLVRVDVDCGPCQKKACVEDHRCMTGITPQMVLTAADKLLSRHPRLPG
ncbi:lipopolysaccharide heptosyltransferase II [bacterium]|nr:lipopolysaccharide heptosyltransferase II [bacterium]